MKPNRLLLVLGMLALPAWAWADPAAQPLDVPAKTLPVPTADISPGMQAIIARPLNPDWDKLWKTGEETRAYADAQAARTVKGIPAMLERLHVTSEASTMDGVRVHVITPETMPEANRGKVLIHVHGLWLWTRRLGVRPRPVHPRQEGVTR